MSDEKKCAVCSKEEHEKFVECTCPHCGKEFHIWEAHPDFDYERCIICSKTKGDCPWDSDMRY